MRRTSIACALTAISVLAQSPKPGGSAILQGTVRNAQSHPVSAAVFLVDLQGGSSTTRADADGRYRFPALTGGTYTVRAEMAGYTAASSGPFALGSQETKRVDLTLARAATAEFYDEPSFVVAGVVDTNSRGGHGSDTVVRSNEALAREAALLSKDSPGSVTEESLRAEIERQPANADLHHALGNVAEGKGNALEAVREYQRAAELNPSENNLFDWGTELLIHRAPEQAIAVFAKGNRTFPNSARMLLALGAAFHARGSYDEAAQRFFAAADLSPADPGPYLFLGKLQTPEITQMDGYAERLGRFAALQPDNALANYYYATSLWRRWKGLDDHKTAARVQSLLEKAVRIDPNLGDAWLQLGMVHSSLMEFSSAISSYEKAIAAGTQQQDVHYRLGQAWQHTGETAKARREFDLYEQLRKTSAAETERERHQIQQFVFALRQ